MQTPEELLARAVSIAEKAHAGHKDRYGAPYILHPLRVMARVETPEERIVAILHDVVEDTDWTFERLSAAGFPVHIISALDSVTKREGESYEAFVGRSAAHPLGRKVKLADLEDNMDLRRMPAVTAEDLPRLQKYLKAWKALTHEQ